MKYAGFAAVIIAAGIFGITFSRQQWAHINELKSFCFMLELFRSELYSKKLSIPHAAEQILVQISGTAKDFLALFAAGLNNIGENNLDEIWHSAIKSSVYCMDKSELEALDKLGETLGKYDLEQQVSSIDCCLSYLNTSCCKRENALPEQRKLSFGLSACIGTMLAILLV